MALLLGDAGDPRSCSRERLKGTMSCNDERRSVRTSERMTVQKSWTAQYRTSLWKAGGTQSRLQLAKPTKLGNLSCL